MKESFDKLANRLIEFLGLLTDRFEMDEPREGGMLRACLKLILILLSWQGVNAYAYTANNVAFEFLENGQYRVTVAYTVPELKEFRESYVLFRKKKEAEAFYWKLIKGADFYPDDPGKIRYVEPKSQPTPW